MRRSSAPEEMLRRVHLRSSASRLSHGEEKPGISRPLRRASPPSPPRGDNRDEPPVLSTGGSVLPARSRTPSRAQGAPARDRSRESDSSRREASRTAFAHTTSRCARHRHRSEAAERSRRLASSRGGDCIPPLPPLSSGDAARLPRARTARRDCRPSAAAAIMWAILCASRRSIREREIEERRRLSEAGACGRIPRGWTPTGMWMN